MLREFLDQGLSDQLMAWAFFQLQARHVSEIYDRAFRLYQKYGFQMCGEYDFPAEEHIDLEWIMKKANFRGINKF
ncbi:MAG: hypothetical protein OSB05_10680 [Akkermansiaceae bacterium]|nr:hypothetical protein [Akkermansiaceae bacterium]